DRAPAPSVVLPRAPIDVVLLDSPSASGSEAHRGAIRTPRPRCPVGIECDGWGATCAPILSGSRHCWQRLLTALRKCRRVRAGSSANNGGCACCKNCLQLASCLFC